ncbi:uncharacterized protein L203_104125 [Cryptococcus depauperatus CBS 7841]|uniref:Uncharacterized protein n=1 Tax=Cryptococcus depauperatus CBS 7841 TaxID=1295531 RepID=A0A1E3IBD0_9TREE|nr:hypothetical protein L203_04422 [Cryptococcus depauperatus CBS 7841]
MLSASAIVPPAILPSPLSAHRRDTIKDLPPLSQPQPPCIMSTLEEPFITNVLETVGRLGKSAYNTNNHLRSYKKLAYSVDELNRMTQEEQDAYIQQTAADTYHAAFQDRLTGCVAVVPGTNKDDGSVYPRIFLDKSVATAAYHDLDGGLSRLANSVARETQKQSFYGAAYNQFCPTTANGITSHVQHSLVPDPGSVLSVQYEEGKKAWEEELRRHSMEEVKAIAEGYGGYSCAPLGIVLEDQLVGDTNMAHMGFTFRDLEDAATQARDVEEGTKRRMLERKGRWERDRPMESGIDDEQVERHRRAWEGHKKRNLPIVKDGLRRVLAGASPTDRTDLSGISLAPVFCLDPCASSYESGRATVTDNAGKELPGRGIVFSGSDISIGCYDGGTDVDSLLPKPEDCDRMLEGYRTTQGGTAGFGTGV